MTPESLWVTFANACLFLAILTVPIAIVERHAIRQWYRDVFGKLP